MENLVHHHDFDVQSLCGLGWRCACSQRARRLYSCAAGSSQEGSRETSFFFRGRGWGGGGRGCAASFLFTFGEVGRRKYSHVAVTNLGSALPIMGGGGGHLQL